MTTHQLPPDNLDALTIFYLSLLCKWMTGAVPLYAQHCALLLEVYPLSQNITSVEALALSQLQLLMPCVLRVLNLPLLDCDQECFWKDLVSKWIMWIYPSFAFSNWMSLKKTVWLNTILFSKSVLLPKMYVNDTKRKLIFMQRMAKWRRGRGKRQHKIKTSMPMHARKCFFYIFYFEPVLRLE